jgi:hypothetical protein
LNAMVDQLNQTVANGERYQNAKFVGSLRALVSSAREL